MYGLVGNVQVRIHANDVHVDPQSVVRPNASEVARNPPTQIVHVTVSETQGISGLVHWYIIDRYNYLCYSIISIECVMNGQCMTTMVYFWYVSFQSPRRRHMTMRTGLHLNANLHARCSN